MTIKTLESKLAALNEKHEQEAGEVEKDLQKEYNKLFADLPALRDALTALESSNEYGYDDSGELIRWVDFDVSAFKDCREYFEAYLEFVRVDWIYDRLYDVEGDYIYIDTGYGRNAGHVLSVDFGRCAKIIVDKKLFTTDDGEVNVHVRNSLIEQYMEKTGYYPGVFTGDERQQDIWPAKDFEVVPKEKWILSLPTEEETDNGS